MWVLNWMWRWNLYYCVKHSNKVVPFVSDLVIMLLNIQINFIYTFLPNFVILTTVRRFLPRLVFHNWIYLFYVFITLIHQMWELKYLIMLLEYRLYENTWFKSISIIYVKTNNIFNPKVKKTCNFFQNNFKMTFKITLLYYWLYRIYLRREISSIICWEGKINFVIASFNWN